MVREIDILLLPFNVVTGGRLDSREDNKNPVVPAAWKTQLWTDGFSISPMIRPCSFSWLLSHYVCPKRLRYNCQLTLWLRGSMVSV